MKRFAGFWFAVAGLLVSVGPAPAQADRRALLIGVSVYDHYHKNGLFENLSCSEDLRRIEAALVKTFGFQSGHGSITVLDNSRDPAQGTRAAILAAFGNLVRDTKRGDVVYLHFSGHGSQVLDPTKPSGLESTIVPTDYRDDQTSEDASGEISGRTIQGFVRQILAKQPRQLVLSFDSCHSASATRGYAHKRGVSYDEYLVWRRTHHQRPAPPPTVRAVQRGEHQTVGSAMDDLHGRGYVVLSACADDSTAFECNDHGQTVGRFSDSLARILSSAGPDTTYADVYAQLRATFRQRFPDQEPQIDGDPKTTLFGGTAAPVKPYFLVTMPQPGRYLLNAGKLHGVTVGSVLTLSPLTGGGRESARAVVDRVRLTEADLTLTRRTAAFDALLGQQGGARATEQTHNYGDLQLVMDVSSLRRTVPAAASAVIACLRGLRMVRLTTGGRPPDVKLVRIPTSHGGSRLFLARADTGILLGSPLRRTRDLPQEIAGALQRQAGYYYTTTVLNKTGLTGGLPVQIRLVPAETATEADGTLAWREDTPWDGRTLFRVGDYFTIEVRNPGDQPLYLNVLDVDSDGRIGRVWPVPGHSVQDNVLQCTLTDPAHAPRYQRGSSPDWVKVWADSDTSVPLLLRFSAGDSNEIYKVIATDVPVDLSPLANRDLSGSKRGLTSPFDELFAPAVGGATRGEASVSAPSAWGTAIFPFAVWGP